jgi:hypothetical protein
MASLTDFVDFSSKPLLCELVSLQDLNNLHVIDPQQGPPRLLLLTQFSGSEYSVSIAKIKLQWQSFIS